MASIDCTRCRRDRSTARRLQAVAVVLVGVVAGRAHAQGFTSAAISTGQVPSLSSIGLAVSSVNGTSYTAYTIGSGAAGEVFYATKPSGGAWSTEDANIYGSEVSLTTTQFTQGNVMPHLAVTDFYRAGPPSVEGHLAWATRSTGGVWTYETVDAATTQADGRYAHSPSVTLNFNAPRIAYWLSQGTYGSRTYLKLAIRNGTNSWTTEVVDSTGDSYDNITLRMLSSEVLTFTRYRSSVGLYEFLYAYRSGSNWVLEEIEPHASNPQNGAMTMPSSGIPEVAYMTVDGYLNYAYRDPSSGWIRTKLRPTLTYFVARGISIIHGSSNYPSIAYYSVNGDSLRLASQSKFGWNFQRVAPVLDWRPLAIGVFGSNPVKAKIAYVATLSGGADEYDLAEGSETLFGNSKADPGGQPVTTAPTIGVSIDVRGHSVTSRDIVTFEIAQPSAGDVGLLLLDVRGRVVARHPNVWAAAGRGQLDWNLRAVPSGLYFARLLTRNGAFATTKVLIAH